MRSISQTTWLRMLLALTAVGVVGGPGVVLAGGNFNATYSRPAYINIIGPDRVPVATSQAYTLDVVYTDGSHSSATYPQAVFNVASGPGSFVANFFSSPRIGVARIEGRLRASTNVRLVATKNVVISPRRVPGSSLHNLPIKNGSGGGNE